MNSLRFFRYTQRRSPMRSPRFSRDQASRLLRASISKNVLTFWPVASDHSSAGSLDLACSDRSKSWIRFMPGLMRSRCHHTALQAILVLLFLIVSGCSHHRQEIRRVRIATYTQGSLTALPLMLVETS